MKSGRRQAGLATRLTPCPASIDLVRSQTPPPRARSRRNTPFWSGRKPNWLPTASPAIELYDEAGAIMSRFALNLPVHQRRAALVEASCEWEVFEEVSPFGSEERRLLHAGRGLCVSEAGATRMVGTIVIHAMLDYGSLPFITSQNPYVELFQSRPSFGPGTR
jgi:hypothetical protein